MWIFCRYGFFSVVCARKGSGALSQPPDPDRIMVRARNKGHLTALLEAFPALLEAASEIHESRTSDYRCRVFVPKGVWAEVMYDLVQETDYDNFKSACKAGEVDSGYVDKLHQVWSVMYGYQQDNYGPGLYCPENRKQVYVEPDDLDLDLDELSDEDGETRAAGLAEADDWLESDDSGETPDEALDALGYEEGG